MSKPQPAARPLSEVFTQHVDNMRVRQSRVHSGDTRYFVEAANGYVVRGPYINREQAEQALNHLRRRAREEFVE